MVRGMHDDQNATYMPSPAEIQAAADLINASWSNYERSQRQVGPGAVPVETLPTRIVTAMRGKEMLWREIRT